MDTTNAGDDARNAQIEASMREVGVAVDVPVEPDYFGFDVRHRVNLPGSSTQWVEHRELTDGMKRQYLNMNNRHVTQSKVTGDMKFDLKPGDERLNLLRLAIVDWRVLKNGSPVQFSPRILEQFLNAAPPTVVDAIDKDVREKNSWLLADVTVEGIEQQIAELQEVLEQKKRALEGEAVSSSS